MFNLGIAPILVTSCGLSLERKLGALPIDRVPVNSHSSRVRSSPADPLHRENVSSLRCNTGWSLWPWGTGRTEGCWRRNSCLRISSAIWFVLNRCKPAELTGAQWLLEHGGIKQQPGGGENNKPPRTGRERRNVTIWRLPRNRQPIPREERVVRSTGVEYASFRSKYLLQRRHLSRCSGQVCVEGTCTIFPMWAAKWG